MGPEQDISVLVNQTNGIRWDGTGVGYGVRGSRREDLTIRLGGRLGVPKQDHFSPSQTSFKSSMTRHRELPPSSTIHSPVLFGQSRQSFLCRATALTLREKTSYDTLTRERDQKN